MKQNATIVGFAWCEERRMDLIGFAVAQNGLGLLISGLVDIIQTEFAERFQRSQCRLIPRLLRTAARAVEHLRRICGQ